MAVWGGARRRGPDTDSAMTIRGCRRLAGGDAAARSRGQGGRRLEAESFGARDFEALRSRSVCRAAGSIFLTATHFLMRATSTSFMALTLLRDALSARKSSRGWSTAAPPAPVPCRSAYQGTAPDPGIPVIAGDKPLGTLGSAVQGRALALLRLDRVADALSPGNRCGREVTIRLEKPDWARFRFPGEPQG